MEHFDVAIVGAGPAGSATALCLARAKLNVLLVERAKAVGHKNVFGGRIYSYPLHDLMPDWQKDCPVERYVTREVFAFMTDDQCLQVQFESPRLGSGRAASFTAYRAKFDNWLAGKAEAEGAMLITGTRVDDLLLENGRVTGIVAAGDAVKADVVVAADGVVSKFTQRLGLRGEASARSVSVGVKETVELAPAVVQDRFGLDEKSGAAYVLAGSASGGLRGGGFLYTNRDSVSLGLVVRAEDLSLRKVEIHTLQEKFRRHPTIAGLLKGGKVTEYSTHMIPEMGMRMLHRPFADNFLAVGDAAGFLINNGYTFRGVDLAIASGIAAAEAITSAKSRGDFSSPFLSSFMENLRRAKVTTELETFRNGQRFMGRHSLYSVYPEMACSLFERVFTVDGSGNRRLAEVALDELKKKNVSLVGLLRDLVRGARSM